MFVICKDCEVYITIKDKTTTLKKGGMLFVSKGEGYNIRVKSYSSISDSCIFIYLNEKIMMPLVKMIKASYSEILNNEAIDNTRIFESTKNDPELINCLLDMVFFEKDQVIVATLFLAMINKFPDRYKIMKKIISSKNDTTVDKIISIFESSPPEDWNFGYVCQKLFYSSSTLRRRLESEHTSFKKVLLEYRMHKSVELLKNTDDSIYIICDKLGYRYPSYFIKVFKNFYGVTPRFFRMT